MSSVFELEGIYTALETEDGKEGRSLNILYDRAVDLFNKGTR